MKIDLVDTKVSAFCDIGVDQYVELPQRQVCSIIGDNQDDGGSNASGKSSFINSVPVNLYGPKVIGVPAADLKNRYLDEATNILNTYVLDGVPLIVDRTIGGKLRFKFGDADWVEGKVDDVQEKLNLIIKITPEQLLFLSYKPQEDASNFFTMTDTNKKDFLSSFFPLENYEKGKESADLECKMASAKKTANIAKIGMLTSNISTTAAELAESEKLSITLKAQANSTITTLESQIGTLTNAIDGLSHILTDANLIHGSQEYIAAKTKYDSDLAQANLLFENGVQKVTALQREQNTNLAALRDFKIEIPEELTRDLDNVERALANMKAIMDKDAALQSKTSYIRQDLNKKVAQMEASKRSPTCAACGQELKNHDSSKHLLPLQKEIDEKMGELELISKELGSLPPTSYAELSSLQSFQKDLIGKIAKIRSSSNKELLQKEIDMTLEKIKAANREVDIIESDFRRLAKELAQAEASVVSNLKSQLAMRMIERDRANAELSSIRLQLANAETNVNKLQHKLNAAKQDLITAELAQKQIESDLQIAEIGAYILSKAGFIGYLFDGILEDLNREVNDMLKQIPNVRQYSLRFTPDTAIKTTGAINKSINYFLTDSAGTKNFKTMSGGEKLGIYIAVDESLNDILSRRLGVQIGWKFLDEQFTWIDQNSKEAILSFYKLRSNKKTYFIVDHASEFNAALDSQINIVKRNKIARIEYGTQTA